MKLVVLAVVVAIGCGSKGEPSAGTGSATQVARAPVTDPIGFCERARMVMFGRQKCFPEDTSIKMGMQELLDLVKDAPAEAEPRRKVAAKCAVMLQGLMRAEQPKNCPLDVTDVERGELEAFLAAWYGERTPPPKTGTADVDEALVKLAGQRDAACACKDIACARKAADELATSLPSGASPDATEAAAKMIDEVGRCLKRLVNAPPR